MNFKDWNANYWNKGNPKGDCVIRALCRTTLYGYKYLCDALGAGDDFIMGAGFMGGFDLGQIDDFAKKSGLIVKITSDNEFTEDDVALSYADLKLLRKMAARKGVNRTASFMFTLVGDGENGKWQHATAFIKKGEDLEHVDVSACQDSIYAVPTAIYAIPLDKVCPRDNPNRYENERKRILTEWTREIMAKKGK